jgi:pantothenate kinase
LGSILDDDQDAAARSCVSRTSDMSNVTDIAIELRRRATGTDRYLIAIAGPPGAGKTKLASVLAQELLPETAAVIPMDGFHYDNAVLDTRGLRARKGAPETFDYWGLETLLYRIRKNESEIALPVFDRKADLARAGAAVIDQNVRFAIVEGNYLLLNEDPWSRLASYFDFMLFINAPKSELKQRLLERWTDLGDSEIAAQARVATNDMPNVDRVLSARRKADLSLMYCTTTELRFQSH